MKESFFKFPSTPHLEVMPGVDIRCDKIFTAFERDEFLLHELTIEEKIDGANLGISFDAEGNIRIQNRGAYLQLPGTGQWKKLGEWLAPRSDVFFDCLADRYILFGEWCYAQHSIYYDRLPDWFLAFDLYDREFQQFLSVTRRNNILETMNISKVPHLARGRFSYSDIKAFILQSKLTDQPSEGIYMRVDQDDWLSQRAKLVRPTFIQALEEHWSRQTIKPNRLSLEFSG